MLKWTTLAMTTALAVTASAQAGGREAGGAGVGLGCRPIGAIIAADPQFSTLRAALQQADLLAVVNGPAMYTLFAPTNAAFARIPNDQMRAILNDKVALTRLLSYHVVKGQVTLKNARPSALNTLAGVPITVRPVGAEVFVNDTPVNRADIVACNGYVQVINRVLIPDDLGVGLVATDTAPPGAGDGNVIDAMNTVVTVIQADPQFRTLGTAIDAAGLGETLASGMYTVLAPTETAWAAVPAATREALFADPEALRAILAYHVVPGVITNPALLGGSPTVLGAPVPPVPVGPAVRTSNGVVYKIDRVLIPPGFQLP